MVGFMLYSITPFPQITVYSHNTNNYTLYQILTSDQITELWDNPIKEVEYPKRHGYVEFKIHY